MSKPYQENVPTVLNELQTNPETGLTEAEAQKRLAQYGANAFEEEKREPIIKLILHQFTDVSVLVLLFAAIVSFLLALREDNGFIEPIVILSVIILNSVLNIVQERNAGKAINALQQLNAPICIVIRDGIKQEIESSQVVPGDIIVFETGDLIPADARLISSVSLRIEESALTGESEPMEKDANIVCEADCPIADRQNMIFSSCLVVSGRGEAVVVGTGMQTEIGKIASLIKNAKRLKTPLQKRLGRISQIISFIAIASAILLLFIGLLQHEPFWNMLLVAVSLAVAAVPETLSLIVTLTLSHGIQEMVKENALIRKLPAVETLGSVSIICSDKTGTLTQNRMSIKSLWIPEHEIVKASDDFTPEYIDFIEKLTLASNAIIQRNDDGTSLILGDSTETSIIRLFESKNFDRDELQSRFERIHELPFDSERKLMSTIQQLPDGKFLILTKGALDRLPVHWHGDQKQEAKKVHDLFASKAYRILALGYKIVDDLPEEIISDDIETDLEFVGLIGIIDPPRPESITAVAEARKAGIRTIMITGDHVATATAIASEINILRPGDGVMSGDQLNKIDDDELYNIIDNYAVYARVSPEDKIRIVEAWQQRGDVVAMTGDGVNDAPALQAADVGISMGIAGTDVAKGAADMILTDDNFATIVKAVRQGRYVFANIRKAVYFLLTCNFSEIIMMLVAQLVGWGAMMTPAQLLFINVIGDGIPGLSLAKETPDARIMDRKPIGRDESFFGGGMSLLIAYQSFLFACVSLAGFYIGKFVALTPSIVPSHELGQTMAFFITGWTSVLHIFTARSRKSIFRADYKSNPQLTISAIAMLIVFSLTLLLKPAQIVLGLVPVSGIYWPIMIGLSLIPLIFAELNKRYGTWQERREKRKLLHRCSQESESNDY